MTMLESPNTKVTIRPLAVTIGAEVSGIDLAKEQDDATIAEIRRALLDWKVLFFRDQDITTEQHLAANGATEEEPSSFDAQYPHPHHSVIRTHSEAGRKAIDDNSAFTREIDGMDEAESAELLEVLYRQAAYPEYQVRFSWERHAIAFWDNRACQHYAVSVYWPQVRKVERVTVMGDRPYYDPDQAPTQPPEWTFRGVRQRWSDS